jgi:hypothetical protein
LITGRLSCTNPENVLGTNSMDTSREPNGRIMPTACSLATRTHPRSDTRYNKATADCPRRHVSPGGGLAKRGRAANPRTLLSSEMRAVLRSQAWRTAPKWMCDCTRHKAEAATVARIGTSRTGTSDSASARSCGKALPRRLKSSSVRLRMRMLALQAPRPRTGGRTQRVGPPAPPPRNRHAPDSLIEDEPAAGLLRAGGGLGPEPQREHEAGPRRDGQRLDGAHLVSSASKLPVPHALLGQADKRALRGRVPRVGGGDFKRAHKLLQVPGSSWPVSPRDQRRQRTWARDRIQTPPARDAARAPAPRGGRTGSSRARGAGSAR